MIIVIRYCGGCNCQIDRSKIIKEVEVLLPAGYQFTTDISSSPFGLGILLCGCSSACAQSPELSDLARHWIIVAGKTVNFRELPEDKLAAAIRDTIKEIEN